MGPAFETFLGIALLVVVPLVVLLTLTRSFWKRLWKRLIYLDQCDQQEIRSRKKAESEVSRLVGQYDNPDQTEQQEEQCHERH